MPRPLLVGAFLCFIDLADVVFCSSELAAGHHLTTPDYSLSNRINSEYLPSRMGFGEPSSGRQCAAG